MKGFGVFFAISLFSAASMLAAPPPDIVLVNGVVYALPESGDSGVKLPLELLWKDPEARLALSPTPGGNSAAGLWRGYVAIWEVADQSLYLRGLNAWYRRARADLKTIFPATYTDGGVKADWFTDSLKLSTAYYPPPDVLDFDLPFRRGTLVPRDELYYRTDPYDPCTSPSEQTPDLVLCDAKVYMLPAEQSEQVLPLRGIWDNPQLRPKLTSSPYGAMSDNCLRGYVAIWEIDGNSLFLKGLDAWAYDRKADLKQVFPRTCQKGRVKATWFSGTLTLETTAFPQREPRYPRITLRFQDGDLVDNDAESLRSQLETQEVPRDSLPQGTVVDRLAAALGDQAQVGDVRIWRPVEPPREPSSRLRLALSEPSLYAMRADSAAEVYRFIWLRSFHHPVAVRIEVKDEGGMVVSRVCDGVGEDKPGELMVNKWSALSPPQRAELSAKLDSAVFWNLSPTHPRSGFDGATWIIEAVKHGRYHVVHRWSPRPGAFRDLALFFLKVGRIDEAPIY